MGGSNDLLFSTLMPGEQALLSDLRENAKTVATSLAKFPTHQNQCDSCLRRVENPVMTLDEYTSLLHKTDRSRAAVKDHVWTLVLKQIDEEMSESIKRETASRKALVDAQSKLNADQYRAQKEAEIISEVESQLAPFSTEYFDSRRQAMMNMVDLTIKTEEEALLHKRRAQLLPLASTITSTAIGAAHKALDEGLAASLNTAQTDQASTADTQPTPLPGEDKLDSLIARLSDSFSNKLNDVATAASNSSSKIDQLATALDMRLSRLEGKTPATDALAASGGGFITARQAAFIHTCATDNFADHDLLQLNTQRAQENIIPWALSSAESELEYLDPPNVGNLGLNLITPDETPPVVPDPTHFPPLQQPANQAESSTTPHPATNPRTTLATYQPPPKPNYVAVAASSDWKQVQSRRNKAKGKNNNQFQSTRTATQNATTTNNIPTKTQNSRPAQRPESVMTQITVQCPPNSIVTSLEDAPLICRCVTVTLSNAKSTLKLLSGRWATHTVCTTTFIPSRVISHLPA